MATGLVLTDEVIPRSLGAKDMPTIECLHITIVIVYRPVGGREAFSNPLLHLGVGLHTSRAAKGESIRECSAHTRHVETVDSETRYRRMGRDMSR